MASTNNVRFSNDVASESAVRAPSPQPYPGMVWIPGGAFQMGSDTHYPEERPAHRVSVDGFWIDSCPVTNARFQKFVAATNHVTVAEIPPDPRDYPGALPHMLYAGSLVFVKPPGPVDRRNIGNWWHYLRGANWRHPYGPRSSIHGKSEHPVVHVSFADAEAFALGLQRDRERLVLGRARDGVGRMEPEPRSDRERGLPVPEMRRDENRAFPLLDDLARIVGPADVEVLGGALERNPLEEPPGLDRHAEEVTVGVEHALLDLRLGPLAQRLAQEGARGVRMAPVDRSRDARRRAQDARQTAVGQPGGSAQDAVDETGRGSWVSSSTYWNRT